MKYKEELSKIFHDARTPLVPLSGYLQLLEEELKEKNIDIDYLDILLKSTEEIDKGLDVLRDKVTQIIDDLTHE